MSRLDVREDDLGGPEVAALLGAHLAAMHEHSPTGSVHALDLDRLRDPTVTVWSVWDGEVLAGCGALRELADVGGSTHGEVKSMRTAPTHLRRGVATLLLEHVVAVAVERGYDRLSLETGSGPAFEPAHALYLRHGFEPCGPFGDYPSDPPDPFSRFFTLSLRGDRLASWLDGLGLVPHLGAAGLPTLTRDGAGRAVWTDPGTGEPLTTDQLEQLDALLRTEGTDPRHAVPVPLLQLARQARLREELLASPCLTYETYAALRGTSVDAARFAIHKAGGRHRLLVVADGERALVPAFQLTADGEPRPDLASVVEPLLAARMDPWRVWGWLTQPAALLGGLVPHVAAADPDTADLVVHAAVRLSERV